MQFLLFRYKAPLVSFGDERAGLNRTTSKTPQKSAIVGLVKAGLGVDKFDEFPNNIKFSYIILNDGINVFDYQNFHIQKNIGLIYGKKTKDDKGFNEDLTNKQLNKFYLSEFDGVVCIVEDMDNLKKYKNALTFPIYPLYGGRKKCVLERTHPEIIEGNTLKDVFEIYKNKYNIQKHPKYIGFEGGIIPGFSGEIRYKFKRDICNKSILKANSYYGPKDINKPYDAEHNMFNERKEYFIEMEED